LVFLNRLSATGTDSFLFDYGNDKVLLEEVSARGLDWFSGHLKADRADIVGNFLL
jgi:hypothetical protein